MHVLLVHQVYTGLSQPGGTRHAELFRGLARRGHTVTIIAGGRNYLTGRPVVEQLPVPAELRGKLRIVRMPELFDVHSTPAARVLSQMAFAVRVFALTRRLSGIDIVVGTSPPVAQGLSTYAVARRLGVPYVFEIRDLWLEYARDILPGIRSRSRRLVLKQAIALLRGAERHVLRNADAVICNSPGHMKPLLECGIRRERLHLVPNAVDLNAITPATGPLALRSAIGFTPQDFVLLYAGAHGFLNDLDTLLSAARCLRDVPNIKILLIGDGPEKARLIARSRREQLGNITFLDPRPKNEMGDWFALADAGVALLRDARSLATVLPNKALDCLAAGKPLVAAIRGPVQRILSEANAGIAVQPTDAPALAEALRRLESDREVCRRMGENGRLYMEKHYSRAAQVDALEEILLKTLAQEQSTNK